MAGWKATYERLKALDQVSPLEPATLLELGTSAYLHSLSSTMVHGVGRDAKRVAEAIERQTKGVYQAPAGAAATIRRSSTAERTNVTAV
jgi:hypothetical protein